MKRLMVVLVATGVSVQVASAQEKKKAEPEPAAAPAMPMAPDPALQAQYKDMVGKWKCEGKWAFGGAAMPVKSTATFAWDLEGYWLVSKMESPKSKLGPGYKAIAYWGYDPGSKNLVQSGVDSMGSWTQMTSKGWEGDQIVWTGKENMMGMSRDVTETTTRKGPKAVNIAGKSGAGDQEASWDLTCRK